MSDIFLDRGYVVQRSLLPTGMASFLADQLWMSRLVDPTRGGDRQVPISYAMYAGVPFETLLCRLAKQLSDITGISLLPTYSYARIYDPGAVLKRHRDRPACENSVTITLDYSGVSPWPIFVQDKSGKDAEIVLSPGDALIYRGCECFHWRDSYECGDWQAQVFLHYVDASGPNAREIYDGRPFAGFGKKRAPLIVGEMPAD